MSMQLHKVLRAICLDGERVEPGSTVELVPVLGAELRAAGKVELIEGEGKPAKASEPKPALIARVVKAAKPAKGADKAGDSKPAESTPDGANAAE